MKLLLKLISALLLLPLLWQPQAALAQGLECAKFIGGGSYTLTSGETLDGNLCLFGGVATIEDGAIVNGDARVMAGSLRVGGQVRGDILATGGAITLDGTAVVGGDVNLSAASLSRSPEASVGGEINQRWSGSSMPIPGLTPSAGAPSLLAPVWNGLLILFQAFVWAVVALLVLLFFPRQTETAAQAVIRQPFIVLGMGILTSFVMPILLVAVAITLIGLPLALLGALLLGAAWAFGMVVLGLEVGRRLVAALKLDLAPAVQAGLGIFLLALATGLVGQVWCVGPIAAALVSMVGLGAVLLTVFGTRPYPPAELAADHALAGRKLEQEGQGDQELGQVVGDHDA